MWYGSFNAGRGGEGKGVCDAFMRKESGGKMNNFNYNGAYIGGV